ncbi:MAG: hypothetical protein K0U47_02905 [Epsilonproteobacteria bacterium]|nr:hypothetical protein [Campylobacterota bacterium]
MYQFIAGAAIGVLGVLVLNNKKTKALATKAKESVVETVTEGVDTVKATAACVKEKKEEVKSSKEEVKAVDTKDAK